MTISDNVSINHCNDSILGELDIALGILHFSYFSPNIKQVKANMSIFTQQNTEHFVWEDSFWVLCYVLTIWECKSISDTEQKCIFITRIPIGTLNKKTI